MTKTPPKTHDDACTEIIDEIMDTFNFGQVEQMMRATDWKWRTEEDAQERELPDERRLRRAAREMLREAARTRCGSSCGGFTALYQSGMDEDERRPFVYLRLYWGLDSHDTEGVCYGEADPAPNPAPSSGKAKNHDAPEDWSDLHTLIDQVARMNSRVPKEQNQQWHLAVVALCAFYNERTGKEWRES